MIAAADRQRGGRPTLLLVVASIAVDRSLVDGQVVVDLTAV